MLPPLSAFIAALQGTGFAFLMTVLGSALVLLPGKAVRPGIERMSLGFAAGIMIAASVWSLLIPAIDEAGKAGGAGWIPAAGGFAAGVAALLLFDALLPHLHPTESTPEGPKTHLPKTVLLVFAVTLHNIPEGMSVGLSYAFAALGSDPGALSAAGALALGIGIQNIPEGFAVALPLRTAGKGRLRAFLGGALSGAVEPLFGLAVVIAAPLIAPVMPWMLSFAAGAMMYVVVEELIPAAHLDSKRHDGTLSILAGFTLMMVLDTAFG